MENVRALRRQGRFLSVKPRADVDESLAAGIEPMQHAEDLADLCAGLASAVAGALHADACLVSLLENDGTVLRDVAASVDEPGLLNLVADSFELSEFPVTKHVIDTGEAVEMSVSDESIDRNERAILEELGFSRVLLCAFEVDGDSVGTVEAYRIEDRPFRRDDPKDVSVLAAVARRLYEVADGGAARSSLREDARGAGVGARSARPLHAGPHESHP